MINQLAPHPNVFSPQSRMCWKHFPSSKFWCCVVRCRVVHPGRPGQPSGQALRGQPLRADAHAGADAPRDAEASVRTQPNFGNFPRFPFSEMWWSVKIRAAFHRRLETAERIEQSRAMRDNADYPLLSKQLQQNRFYSCVWFSSPFIIDI